MQHNAKSIRPFIGARNFEMSRQFYRDLGFEESVVSNGMSFWVHVRNCECDWAVKKSIVEKVESVLK